MLVRVFLFLILVSIFVVPVLGKSGKSEDSKIDLNVIHNNIINKNVEFQRYKERVKIADYKLDKAEYQIGQVGSSWVETNKRREYYPKEAKMNLDYAKWQKTKKEQELVLKGEKFYFDYLLLEEEILLEEEKINRLKNSLEDIQKKIALGLETKSALSDIELIIEKEKLILKNLTNEKEKISMELNVLMNLDMNKQLDVVVVGIPSEEYIADDLENLIEKALTENGEIAKIDVEHSLAYMEKDIYQQHDYKNEYEDKIISLKEKVVEKRYDFEDEKVNAEYEIRSKYNTFLNSKDELTIKVLQIQNLEVDLEVAKKRFDVGFITKDVVEELQEQIGFQKLNLKKAKLSYYIAMEEFKNLLVQK